MPEYRQIINDSQTDSLNDSIACLNIHFRNSAFILDFVFRCQV